MISSAAPPGTPTAGPAATATSFSATISPRASSIEARLELSLDELIKERKKDARRHESVKKDPPQRAKQPAQQHKAARTEKRSALVNKNRGLPVLSESSGNGVAKKRKKAKLASKPAANEKAANKPTKGVTAAQMQTSQKKKKKKNAAVTSATKAQMPQKKTKAGSVQVIKQPYQPIQKPLKQQKKKQQQQQHATPPQIVRIIRQQPPQQQQQHSKAKTSKVNVTSTVGASPGTSSNSKPRRVVRSNDKASKIRMTIRQPKSTSVASKRNQKKAKASQKATIMNVVLPAKVAHNFSSRAAVRAQKVVRRVQNRKQATTKNGTFVVRKPFAVRKI